MIDKGLVTNIIYWYSTLKSQEHRQPTSVSIGDVKQ